MNVGVIGYRRHAARILGILDKFHLNLLSIFHPDAGKFETQNIQLTTRKVFTNDFDSLLKMDAIIIASPTSTHFSYISRIRDSGVYTLCEKPPVTSNKELQVLKQMSNEEKSRFSFNYNYHQTDFCKYVSQANEYARPLSITFTSCHGFAFKSEAKSDWRLKSESYLNNIIGTVASHYIELLVKMYGKPQKLEIRPHRIGPIMQAIDSASIILFYSDFIATGLVSYAAPFQNTFEVIFPNEIYQLRNGIVLHQSPRDYYNEHGNFSPAPIKILTKFDDSKQYYDSSLEKNLKAFLSMAKHKKPLNIQDFDNALWTNEILLTPPESGGTLIIENR